MYEGGQRLSRDQQHLAPRPSQRGKFELAAPIYDIDDDRRRDVPAQDRDPALGLVREPVY